MQQVVITFAVVFHNSMTFSRAHRAFKTYRNILAYFCYKSFCKLQSRNPMMDPIRWWLEFTVSSSVGNYHAKPIINRTFLGTGMPANGQSSATWFTREKNSVENLLSPLQLAVTRQKKLLQNITSNRAMKKKVFHFCHTVIMVAMVML